MVTVAVAVKAEVVVAVTVVAEGAVEGAKEVVAKVEKEGAAAAATTVVVVAAVEVRAAKAQAPRRRPSYCVP